MNNEYNEYMCRLLDLDPNYTVSEAGGLYDTYLARANYLNKIPRESLQRYIADLAANQITDFVVSGTSFLSFSFHLHSQCEQ